MELREYLEIGSRKAGSLTTLGNLLGKGQTNMSQIKSGKMPLPIEDCVKLADYIDADRFDVIAAAKFASAKNEEKKNYWMQFVKSANAAIMIVALSVTTFVTAPEKAFANQGFDNPELYTLQIMRNCRRYF